MNIYLHTFKCVEEILVEFISLNSLRFPRFVVDTSIVSDLMFCDVSQKAFSFVVYIFQKGSAKLIFVKARFSPLIKRTLPSLELFYVLGL